MWLPHNLLYFLNFSDLISCEYKDFRSEGTGLWKRMKGEEIRLLTVALIPCYFGSEYKAEEGIEGTVIGVRPVWWCLIS
uniref:Uncharacterized protein n=1 Tax=Nelumbo nucifera TaxID=4432 RepID=A0A822XWN5_NELNU|nr:TPA_asm: hypothetical protein HUJ06_025626 [Nelumbo nucifera]